MRGTTRHPARAAEIEAAGIEPAIADPDRPGTLLELVGDVTLVHWLLGSAEGESGKVDAVHGPRLQALLERLVDTPVRGFVYEGAGSVGTEVLARGAAIVSAAATTWRIPVEIVETDPTDHRAGLEAMLAASRRLVAS